MAEDIKDPLTKITEWAAEQESMNIYVMSHGEFGVESPIERIFLTALFAVCRHSYYGLPMVAVKTDENFFGRVGEQSLVVVKPQCVVGKYRLDFAIRCADVDGNWPRRFLNVECDGHEFHSRTKDQAQRDRERDRELQMAGFTVFRFTGSELWRDPIACALQAHQWLDKVFLGSAP